MSCGAWVLPGRGCRLCWVTLSAPQRVTAERRAGRPWVVLRLVLVVVALFLLAVAAVCHAQPASIDALRVDVSAGRTQQVQLAGSAAEPGVFLADSATWRVGWRAWRVELPADRPLLQQELTGLLRRGAPDLRVEQTHLTSDSFVFGARVPGWVLVVSLPGFLGGLVLLFAGPEPWRATRFAWFWLSWVPLAPLAFLLLSGPTRGVPPPRQQQRRFTGGWALLLSLILSGVVSAALQVMLSIVWPERL